MIVKDFSRQLTQNYIDVGFYGIDWIDAPEDADEMTPHIFGTEEI